MLYPVVAAAVAAAVVAAAAAAVAVGMVGTGWWWRWWQSPALHTSSLWKIRQSLCVEYDSAEYTPHGTSMLCISHSPKFFAGYHGGMWSSIAS